VKYVVKSVLTQMLATSEKWRKEVMMRNVGQRIAAHAGINQYSRYYATSFGHGALAGSGARTYADGVDSGYAQLTCPNVEWVEQNFPLLHLFQRHIRDGAGAGKFRGGTGAETALVLHDAPEGKARVVAYGVTGLKNSGVGIFGGYPGAPSIIVLVEGAEVGEMMARGQCPERMEEFGGRARMLPYCEFDLQRGDALYLRQSSGGGCGDPLERDSHLVQSDVANGVVSREAAETVCGVVFDERGGLDFAATERRRKALRKDRLKGADLHCVERYSEGESYPPQEILEVWGEGDLKVVRCRRCSGVLCRLGEDWKRTCLVSDVSPLAAGPLMKDLVGHFLLEQHYCPSCGALLDTELVEEQKKSL
jgi:N-methylhydantoinase B/oxoprolinase/acetone carboxylase alpha subunit